MKKREEIEKAGESEVLSSVSENDRDANSIIYIV